MKLHEILRGIAKRLEMKGVNWKPRAYLKAADYLEQHDLKNTAKNGVKELAKLPGIGVGIAEKIIEFYDTGKVKEFEQLRKEIPDSVIELSEIPNIGPKKAVRLYKELKIKSPVDLEKAAKKGMISQLQGFGGKSEQEILDALKFRKKSSSRSTINEAMTVADSILDDLNDLPIIKAEIAGSLRRMKESIGDIDICIQTKNEVSDELSKLPGTTKVIAKGKEKVSSRIKGFQVDFRIFDKEDFGAGLVYFTGSKNYNIFLRKKAIERGLKLSEYGVFRNNKRVAGKTEADVFKALNVDFIPPELREFPPYNPVRDLIDCKDIKGDLQMHSIWSDGADTILGMAKAAKKLRYSFIAMTDHSKSEPQAGGMDEKKLNQYLKKIDNIQSKSPLKILKGAEVDILKDGSLDYSDKILKKLDVVVAAVHRGKTNLTKRVCSALENPYVNILAHPTGRIINRRPSYNIDLNRVAEVAKDNKVAIEINSFPARLDLNDANIMSIKDSNCLFSINTDSHSTTHLPYMKYGVGQARRAGLKKNQVINTYTLNKLEKFLRKK